MARKRIKIDELKDGVLQEELAENSVDNNTIEPMSPVGNTAEVGAAKPQRKGLLFLSLLLVFIVLLSVTLKIVLPQGDPIPQIDISFVCSSDFHLKLKTSGGTLNRTEVLPGDTLETTVAFGLDKNDNTNLSLNNSVFVKARIYGKLGNEYRTNLFGYELDGNWTRSINGYYYFNKILSLGANGESVMEEMTTNIIIGENVGNELQGKNVKVVIEFTILQAEYEAILDVWKDAPYVWQQAMYNKYFNN